MKFEKAVGYLRVSTKDQERHSPHKQYQDIMRYLEEKSYQWRKERLNKVEIELDEKVTGYTVRSDDSTTPEFEAVGIFTEAGSGWKPDSRDEWPKMLQYIGENGIKHLIVGWTDRLYRNMEEYGSLLHMLRTCSADVNIHIINEGVVFNPSHPDDSFEFMQHSFQVIQGFVESQKKSKRVKSARKERFEVGRITHKVPFGYKNVEGGKAEIIPENGEIVKAIFSKYASGKYSITDLTKFLFDKGYRKPTYKRSLRIYVDEPFSRSNIQYILTNRFYLGEVKHHDQSRESDKIPALIDQATFYKVGELLQQRNQRKLGKGKREKSPDPDYSIIGKCHYCGCKISSYPRVIASGRKYFYMKCSSAMKHRDPNWYQRKFGTNHCPNENHTVAGIAQAVDAEFQKIVFDQSLIMWLGEELKYFRKNVKDTEKIMKSDLVSRRLTLEKRKSNLIDMRADGEISKDEYLTKKNDLDSQITGIDRMLNDLTKQTVTPEQEIEVMLDLVVSLRERWDSLPSNQKVEIINIMAKKVVVGENGKNTATLVWEKPWKFLVDVKLPPSSRKDNWHARTDSNCRPSDS